MPRGPSIFKRRDLRAAIETIKAAGVEIARVEIATDGRIIVVIGKPTELGDSDIENEGYQIDKLQSTRG